MKLSAGENIIPITLKDISGGQFSTNSLKNSRFMISFFRFAGCPFCNLRMHRLVQLCAEMGNKAAIVAVFDSPLDNLQKYADQHNAPFPVLADESGKYYADYGIEHSISGVFKGIFFRMPELISAMARGFIPTSLKGRMDTMPADFLIDENGKIIRAYYGKDEGDHLPLEEVRRFFEPDVPSNSKG